eukprot:4672499-Pyramimonas_sp.AAC.1
MIYYKLTNDGLTDYVRRPHIMQFLLEIVRNWNPQNTLRTNEIPAQLINCVYPWRHSLATLACRLTGTTSHHSLFYKLPRLPWIDIYRRLAYSSFQNPYGHTLVHYLGWCPDGPPFAGGAKMASFAAVVAD